MSENRSLYRWPEKLPLPMKTYSYAPKNAFYRTQMEGGEARHRRRSKRIKTVVDVQWKIPRDDMADFRFFVFELVGADAGWGYFLTPLLFDSEVKDMKARFVNAEEPFKVANEENVVHVVTAQLEVYDLDLITENDFYKRNPIKDYSIIDIAVNELLPKDF